LPQHPDTVRTLSDDHVSVSFSATGAGTAADLVAQLALTGVDVADFDVTSPSLDDVFAHVTLTGARS
jgi:ABC-2 type transport system ATP-binding protein